MSANHLAVVKSNYVSSPPQAERWFAQKGGKLVFTGKTYEDHINAWNDAENAVRAGLWGQAMVAASLDRTYGSKGVEEFAKDVEKSPGWIWDLARAYRVFENSSQLENLSVTHHVEAAKAETSEKAHEALAKAFEGKWSTKELQTFVETGIEPARKERVSKVKPGPELQKLHDKAVQDELAAKASIIREWPIQAVDPLLATVYHRMIGMLEWQRNRTVETDCFAIMEVFAADEEGMMEIPECVGESFIAGWLALRGRLMSSTQLKERIETLQTLQMLTDFSRKKSKGIVQRGAVPPVYAPCEEYAAQMERFSFMSAGSKQIAMHADWMNRAKQYAPELIPAQEAQAA